MTNQPAPLRPRLGAAFLLFLLTALAGAQQVVPDSLTPMEGIPLSGGLKELYAIGDGAYSRNTDVQPGTSNQVASYDVTFKVAAGTPSALLHVDTAALLAPGNSSSRLLQAYVGPNAAEFLGYRTLGDGTNAVELPITGQQIAAYRNATTGEIAVRLRLACLTAGTNNVVWNTERLALLTAILPDYGYGVEGSGNPNNTLANLFAVDGVTNKFTSETENGTGHQVASFACYFNVPAGTPGATLHAVSGTDLAGSVLQAYIIQPDLNGDYLGYEPLAPGLSAYDYTITSAQLAQYHDAATGDTLLHLRMYRPASLGSTVVNWSTDQYVVYAAPSNGPALPTDLAATPDANGGIDLTWTDNSANETGFIIERKTGANGVYAQVGTAPANSIDYQDTQNLSPSTTYIYRLRATNVNGDSPNSNESSATTNAPSGPGHCTAYATSASSIRVYWDSVVGATAYNVYRSTSPDARNTGAIVATVTDSSSGILHWDNTTVPSGVDYYYEVTAIVAGSETMPSIEDRISPVAGGLPWNQSDAAILQAARQISGDPNVGVLTPDERVISPSGTSTVLGQTYDPDSGSVILNEPGGTAYLPTYSDTEFGTSTSTGGALAPLKGEGAYRKVETSEKNHPSVFQTKLNGAYVEYSLPSVNSLNVGSPDLSFANGAFVAKIPNSLDAYVGVTTQGPGVNPATSYQVDAGVQYYPAYNGFPSRYSPILRLADGRDHTVKLIALNPSNLNFVQYVPISGDDQAYATMRFVVDRTPRRLVTFRVAIYRIRNFQFTLASNCVMLASAPFGTSINPNIQTDVAIAKNVISLAQNRRRQTTPTRFTTSQPINRDWPNAFWPDGTYATGTSVTRERLIDGYDDSNPDNLNIQWRDQYGDGSGSGNGNSLIYTSTGQAKATTTGGGTEPVTIVNLKHTIAGP